KLVDEILQGKSGRIIWGVFQILLMILGDIGNLITLIVLNRRWMRKCGINNLLQGLAVSDIIAPTIASIPLIIYYYASNKVTNEHVIVFVMPLATAATFASNWIVVTITAFRLFIVIKPLYSQVYCSSRNEKKALTIIFMLSLLSITPYYFDSYFMFSSHIQNIIKLMSAVLSLLGPWIICVILWLILIRVVGQEIGEKNSLKLTLHSEVIAQRIRSKSKITKMVLIICFCNIICQLPVLIRTILDLIDTGSCGRAKTFFFVYLLFTSNLLLIVNHSINFFIYSLTNAKFRYSIKMMCRRCCCLQNLYNPQQSMTIDNSNIKMYKMSPRATHSISTLSARSTVKFLALTRVRDF
ncbi:unnamed protein product, partial [Didymodactylos carnosus]